MKVVIRKIITELQRNAQLTRFFSAIAQLLVHNEQNVSTIVIVYPLQQVC